MSVFLQQQTSDETDWPALFDDLHDPNFPDPNLRDFGQEAIDIMSKDDFEDERNDDFPMICRRLLKRSNPNTPDWKELKKLDNHAIFVYGRLRIGQPYGDLLKDFTYLGEGKTAVEWVVKNSVNQDYPMIFQGNKLQGKACNVYGDIFVVPPEIILELDRLFQNHEKTERRQIYTYCKDQIIEKVGFRPSIPVWSYFGHPQYWKGVFLTNPPEIMTIESGGKKYNVFDITSRA